MTFWDRMMVRKAGGIVGMLVGVVWVVMACGLIIVEGIFAMIGVWPEWGWRNPVGGFACAWATIIFGAAALRWDSRIPGFFLILGSLMGAFLASFLWPLMLLAFIGGILVVFGSRQWVER